MEKAKAKLETTPMNSTPVLLSDLQQTYGRHTIIGTSRSDTIVFVSDIYDKFYLF